MQMSITNPTNAEEDQMYPVPQEEEEEVWVLTLPLQAHHHGEMEEFPYNIWEDRWRVILYDVLPDWLKDSDYLLHCHKPPCPPSWPTSRASCTSIQKLDPSAWFPAVSLFGNLDYAQTKYVLHGPSPREGGFWDVLFGCSVLPQFLLALSHYLLPFRESLLDIFKLDYSVIAVLIMGSFVSQLYHSSCSPQPQLICLSIICVLGISSIILA